jgi:hypothetical protein
MRSPTRSRRFGFLDVVIVLAVVFTAGVHVYLAVSPTSPEPQLRGMFLLAALGYLGTLAALYAPFPILDRVRWLARLGLLGVAVATIVAYFVVVGFYFDTLAIVDKSAEGLLTVALLVDAGRVQGRTDEGWGEAPDRGGRAAA